MKKSKTFGVFRGLMGGRLSLAPKHGGFSSNSKIRKQIERRKRRTVRRLDKNDNRGCNQPMMTASNIHYDIAERTRATAASWSTCGVKTFFRWGPGSARG